MTKCGVKWVLLQGLIWSLASCAVASLDEVSRFRPDDVPSEEETDESSTGGLGNRNAFARFESGRLRFQCSERTAARIPGSGAELMANLAGFVEESQYAVLVNAATSDGASISPDALVAPGLAAQLGAPVLMAERTALPEATRDELTRLGTSNIIIVGGTAVIGDVVEDELRRDGLTVYRIAGADRFETAVAVAKETVVGIGLSRLDNAQIAAQAGEANQAVLVNGANVIDGLAAVAASARYRSPLVYTHTDRLDDATIALFSDAYLEFDHVDVIGGVAAISDAVQSEVGEILPEATTRRVAGPTRFGSAVAVAETLFAPDPASGKDRPVFVIDGTNPIYELAVSAFGSPVLLSEPSTLHAATASYIESNADCVVIVGDQLSDQVVQDADVALNGESATVDGCVVGPVPEHLRTPMPANYAHAPFHEISDGYWIDPFYQKYCDVDGLPIVAPAEVDDEALRAAARAVRHMIAKDPEAYLAGFARIRMRIGIMGNDETPGLTHEQRYQAVSMLPEMQTIYETNPGTNWDDLRGLAPTEYRPILSIGEEHLLCTTGDRSFAQDIFVHEFAHAVHLFGIPLTLQGQITAAYENRPAGVWDNTYAGEDELEYFAVGTQIWYNLFREEGDLPAPPSDDLYNDVNTREELAAVDPQLHALVDQAFIQEFYTGGCHALD